MPKYAVTAVFYIETDDEDQAIHTVDQTIIDSYLYTDRGESWGIVDVCEVESF
jgi:hypothetical protein